MNKGVIIGIILTVGIIIILSYPDNTTIDDCTIQLIDDWSDIPMYPLVPGNDMRQYVLYEHDLCIVGLV